MKVGITFKGKAVQTGEWVRGQLIEANGNINNGQVFICPEVKAASFAGKHEGADAVLMGPFVRVDPDTVEIIKGDEVLVNTKFQFLYRDGGNYKIHNVVVLAGRLTDAEVDEIVACGDCGQFIAEQVGLRHTFPGCLNEDDHPWCEFYNDSLTYGFGGFKPTDEAPNTDMTAHELLENFRAAKGKWDPVTYDPLCGRCI